MEYKNIICQIKDSVATITLNRPENMNALDFATSQEFQECLTQLSLDSSVRALIITGRGRGFCAGGDVKGMKESLPDGGPLYLKKLTRYLHPAMASIRRMPKPVIAAVNGFASGIGFSLALNCDLILAARSARFNSAYILIGLVPDGGLTFHLPRLIGLHRANQLFFTGEQIDAQQALELGFVNQVVADEELMSTAEALARRLAQAPTLAIARTKELVNLSFHENLDTQMEHELQTISEMGKTRDFKEGIQAFFEKRKADFKGY